VLIQIKDMTPKKSLRTWMHSLVNKFNKSLFIDKKGVQNCASYTFTTSPMLSLDEV